MTASFAILIYVLILIFWLCVIVLIVWPLYNVFIARDGLDMFGHLFGYLAELLADLRRSPRDQMIKRLETQMVKQWEKEDAELSRRIKESESARIRREKAQASLKAKRAREEEILSWARANGKLPPGL